MQLIKTAITKAGNGPAALVAAAQHSTEAAMAWLPCICSWVPQAGFPCCQTVLPTGLTPPRMALTVCGRQQFWEGPLSPAFVHQVFM